MATIPLPSAPVLVNGQIILNGQVYSPQQILVQHIGTQNIPQIQQLTSQQAQMLAMQVITTPQATGTTRQAALQQLPPVVILWTLLRTQLDGANKIIVIDSDVSAEFDLADNNYLVNAFRAEVGEDGMIVRDALIDRTLLGPASYFNSSRDLFSVTGQFPVLPPVEPQTTRTAVVKAEPGKAGKAKIPRPPNAFIIYRQERHPAVVAENPTLHNNDISVIIGKMWQDESWQVRAVYKGKAELKKAEHLLKHPGYSYKPRKPCEKKRRMTKKNAATLTPKPSKSFANAKKFSHVAQETGYLAGEAGETRATTLPLSATSSLEISEHNALYTDPNSNVEVRSLPTGITPNAEYVASQQADEHALDMAFDPKSVDVYAVDPNYKGLYYEYSNDYEMAAAFFPDEWTY